MEQKERESRIKKKLSEMPREELEKSLFEKLITPDYSYIHKELDKDAKTIINELLFEQVKETIGNKQFIEKLIYDYQYNYDNNHNIIGTSIHYYSPRPQFQKLVEKAMDSDEIKDYFTKAFKNYLDKNIDVICKNVMYRLFTAGIANSNAVQNAISESISSNY